MKPKYQMQLDCRICLGYNHRFKRRVNKTHPNIWLFIDSIRKEVNTIHDLILQINSGMRPHENDLNPKLLNNEPKNYMIGSTITKLRCKIYYVDFLFLLRMKNKIKIHPLQ